LAGVPRHKARYILQAGGFGPPHIAHNAWFNGRDGYPQPPNSVSIALHATSPSWFETIEEFNLLPYITVRDQIANEVERGMMEVLTSAGGATATGLITTVAKADLIDGETVVLISAAGATITFHFDVSGTYIPGGGYDASNIRVDVSSDTTADDVATTLAAAIDGTVFTAPAPAANILIVTQTAAGTDGNTTMVDTVANAGFLATGFSGGGGATASDIRTGTVA
jgi:hypothetical protein